MENIKSSLKYPKKANLTDWCKWREITLMVITAHIVPEWHQAVGELLGIHPALRPDRGEGLSPWQGTHPDALKAAPATPFPNESWLQSAPEWGLGGAKQPQSSLYTKTNLGCILLLLFSVISSNETNLKWCTQQYLYFANKAYILLGNFCYSALSWKC